MTDAPAISIGSPPVRIYAQRDGDRVTGRVEFPYETYGRTECPINYRSARPDPNRDREGAANLKPLIPNRQSLRLSAVQRYHKMMGATGGSSASALREVCDEFGRKFSTGSLRLWVRKYETDSEDALRDHYTPRPRKVLSLDADQAKAAVTICAWWAFRIGNCQTIDTPMIHAAANAFIPPTGATGGSPGATGGSLGATGGSPGATGGSLGATGGSPGATGGSPGATGGSSASAFPLADVLATIDCYYSWRCDRSKMPFKPFTRWARYDFAKWVLRACDENDYRRGLAAADQSRDRKGAVPLMAPQTLRRSNVPDTRTRKRDVLAQGNRRALESLADPGATGGSSASASTPIQSPLEQASKLRGMGLHRPARQVVQRAAPGIPALAANDNPQTIAESLGRLDDSYRRMLLDAARGDRGCIAEAVATMPIWWDAMPQEPRHNIDFKVAAWICDHPGASDKVIARRKLAMFLPLLRDVRRSGLTALNVCARLPV